MNERTHFLIKIYLSHFILERVVFLVGERWVGDGDRLLFWPKVLLATIAALLFHLSWVAQPWVNCEPKTLCLQLVSIRHLVSNWPEPPRAPGYIIVWRSPASAVLLLIYTGASLDWRVGRGSICYSLTGLNSEFSFLTSCPTKAEEHSLPYYLPIVGGRIIGFIPFPRVLVLCEMQSVSSKIWTRITVSISYDDNHYTTGTSIFFFFPPSTGQDMTQG